MASLLNYKFGYASTLRLTIIFVARFVSADISNKGEGCTVEAI